MIKYLIPLAMLCVSAFGQSVSLHNFNTNQFTTNAHSLPLPTGQWLVNVNTNGVVTFGAISTNSINTNGYVLSVNTNVGSVVYNAITNLSGGGGIFKDVWTNDGNIYPSGKTNAPVRIGDAASELMNNSARFISSYDVHATNGVFARSFLFDVTSDPGFYYESDLQLDQTLGDDSTSVLLTWYAQDATNSATLQMAAYSGTNQSNDLLAYFDAIGYRVKIKQNGDISIIKSIPYSWPLTNSLDGQVMAISQPSHQLYWTNLSAGGGSFVTNAITTNTPAGMTNVIVSVINNNTFPEFWRTNTAESGIRYTNADDPSAIAKFSAQSPGTFASGYTNTGGTVMARENGDVALGIAYGANSAVKSDSGPGFAFGAAYTGGTIISEGSSETTLGEVHNAGTIDATGSGSLVGGYSAFAGRIFNQAGRGNIVWGECEDTNSIITAANNYGGMALGVAFAASTIKVSGYGAIAHGESDSFTGFSGSTIWANGSGSFASGFSDRGATIKAQGDGSHAIGQASKGGQILANVGFAGGFAISNSVIKSEADSLGSDGSFAWGYANGNGSILYSMGKGAFSGGMATNGGMNSATGTVSFTYGQNVGNESSPGFSFAYGRNFTNRTDSTFNVGWFPTPSLILGTNVIQEATDTGGQISPRRVVGKPVTLTTNVATTICTITLPTSLSTLGGKVYATTKIKNATDWGYVTEEFTWGAGNKAATVTTKIAAPAQTCSDGSGGASVATTWTATVSGTTISLKNKAVTSGIAATTTTCIYRIETDADDAIVVTPQ